MAQRHPDPADVLARHLRARATEFLRALRLNRGAATPEDSAEAARALRRAARRISAALYTFQPALDPAWSQRLGPELAWVSGTLSQEDACTTRLLRLQQALHHLSGHTPPSPRRPARRTPASDGAPALTGTSAGGHTGAPGTGPRSVALMPGGPASAAGKPLSPAGSLETGPPDDTTAPRTPEGPTSTTHDDNEPSRPRSLTTGPPDDTTAPRTPEGPASAAARDGAADEPPAPSAEGFRGTPAPARGLGAPVTGPARTAAPAADGPSSTRGLGVPATRPAPRAPGTPAPADGTPPDVPRHADPASDAQSPVRAVRATEALPRAARAAAVTATAQAPASAPADRRPGSEPGAAGVRRAEGDTRAPDRPGSVSAAGGPRPGSRARTAEPRRDSAPLAIGAAKASALLERQLTLARTRAHSAALQALGSARFHAVVDQVAVLASEVPLVSRAGDPDLRPFAEAARERLVDAVAALPLVTAGSPYNAEALVHGLSPDPAPHPQDAPWHQVRLLLRLHRYAQEVLDPAAGDDPRLRAAGEALDRHRDAAEAAAAAAQAARTPRIAPATAYALGVLHAGQRHEVEAARYAFQRAWQQPPAGTP